MTKLEVQLSYALTTSMKMFKATESSKINFRVELTRFMNAASGPGLIVIEPGSSVRKEVTYTGVDHDGKTDQVVSVLDIPADRLSAVAKLLPLANIPIVSIPLFPVAHVITFAQLVPHSSKMFDDAAAYRAFLELKVKIASDKIATFNSRFGTANEKNGKISSLTCEILINQLNK